jgi:hypothetical protein
METPSRMAGMLLWGTANPEGMENDYQGIFLNKEDIKSMVRQVEQATRRAEKIPVHLEHKGVAVGHVVTPRIGWTHQW